MINKPISVKNAILDAQALLGLDHDKDVPVMTLWATRAEQQIGSYYQYERKRFVGTIEGCSLCLPTDAVLVEIAVMGDFGESCDNLLNRFCGNQAVTNTNLDGTSNFLVVDVGGSVGDTISLGYLNYYVQNNKIILDVSRDGEQMTVQYIRYKTDCDGNLEVGSNHLEAIKWFIVWNYYMRGKNKNYIQRDLIFNAEKNWERHCATARADDARMSYSERQEAARLYSNPYTGKGLWQGMYTTLGNSYFIWG